MIRISGLLFAAALFGATSAAADTLGQAEYTAACAACHGSAGKGDGPVAGLLSIEVPDLTTISARNNGAFPMLDIIHVVDGRTGVRAHGGSMPVWGDRYFSELADTSGPYGGEAEVRGRILSLAYYLESIQE